MDDLFDDVKGTSLYKKEVKIFVSTHWNFESKNEVSRHFKRLYRGLYRDKRYNKGLKGPKIEDYTIPVNAALAYDAVHFFMQGYLQACKNLGKPNCSKEPTTKEIVTELRETYDFQGVTGDIAMNFHGDPTDKAVVILKSKKNHFEPTESKIYVDRVHICDLSPDVHLGCH